MKDIHIDQREEEILTFDVSDEALEAAAGTVKDKAGAFTLAFCSGLDTCPAWQPSSRHFRTECSLTRRRKPGASFAVLFCLRPRLGGQETFFAP